MLTAAGVGVIALVVGAVLWKRGKAPKTVGVLMLVAGFGIGGGIFGALLDRLGALVGGLASTLTGRVFGVVVPFALLAGVVVWMWIDFHPKNRKPSKALPYLCLALPVLLSLTGGIWAGIGGQILTAAGQTATDVSTIFVGG
jgi:hypothetical protein